jgi:hypothetical protein
MTVIQLTDLNSLPPLAQQRYQGSKSIQGYFNVRRRYPTSTQNLSVSFILPELKQYTGSIPYDVTIKNLSSTTAASFYIGVDDHIPPPPPTPSVELTVTPDTVQIQGSVHIEVKAQAEFAGSTATSQYSLDGSHWSGLYSGVLNGSGVFAYDQHVDLSWAPQSGQVYLRGTVTYGGNVYTSGSKTLTVTAPPPPLYSNVTIRVTGKGATSPAAGSHPSEFPAGGTLNIYATPSPGWRLRVMRRNGVDWTSSNPGEFLNLGATEDIEVIFEEAAPPPAAAGLEWLGVGVTTAVVTAALIARWLGWI